MREPTCNYFLILSHLVTLYKIYVCTTPYMYTMYYDDNNKAVSRRNPT